MNYQIGINLSQLGARATETAKEHKKVIIIPADTEGIVVNSTGIWLNLVAWESKSPEWGSSHSIKQSLPKEKFGTKTPYVGNMKEMKKKGQDNDDLPFD